MFIMIGVSIAGDGSQSGIRGFGIGFLGGVILKDGFNIRGMNTATLWCTAAIGTLAGLGHFGLAAMGAAGVLSANLILRPVAHRINRVPVQKKGHELLYRLRCTCRTTDEANTRTMLIQNVGRTPLTLIALHSLDDELRIRVNVKAYLKRSVRKYGPELHIRDVLQRSAFPWFFAGFDLQHVCKSGLQPAARTSVDSLNQAPC